MSSATPVSASATLSDRLGFRPAVIELGPSHPSVRRVLAGAGATTSFLVTLDDDRIEDLAVEIGLGHRGFEKEIESRPFAQALPYVARLGHASGPIAQVAYCLALERLAGIETPARATWIRTLVCELARATDHFARIAALAAALGASAAERAARAGEAGAMGLLTRALGGRLLDPWVRPGGVVHDLPSDFGDALAAGQRGIDEAIGDLHRLLLDQSTVAWRLCEVAPLAAADALALGITGPCLRAAGVARDLRRDEPLLAYSEIEFDVAIGSRGDDYDRLAVVVAEIGQSLRIAAACAERMPPGQDESADSLPTPPPGIAEVEVESSTGELGFLLVSDGGALPRRIRCRAPSFFHAQALPALLRHARLDDLLPTAALFHLVSGECDR